MIISLFFSLLLPGFGIVMLRLKDISAVQLSAVMVYS